jgi:hypothetical protein
MERLKGRKPSPAMVVSIIALVFALVGTAAAGVATVSVLSKKEKKQTRNIARDEIRKAAPGLVGPQGPVGQQGPVGPTFATAFANPQDPVPPATPDVTVLNAQYSHTFTTPTSGRLLVFASLKTLTIGCSVGFGNAFLYLDGVGVPGSGQRQPDSVASPATYTPIALSGVVAAGQHTLSISLDCPTGNHTADGSSGDGDLGAVLVGS